MQAWRPGTPIPEDLNHAIDAGATVVAHNVSFDQVIWQAHQVPLGWPPLPWPRWSDTATRARHARLPPSLESAAEALRLPVQKDKAGAALMKQLAKGNREPTPEDINRLAQYAVRDVEVLREIDHRIPELAPDAAAIAAMDHAMNRLGMPVDLDAVRKLLVARDREDARLIKEISEVTAGEITSPTQVLRVQAFLASNNIELPNCTSETLEEWTEANPDRDDVAARVIRIRQDYAHEAGKKLDAIIAAASGSGRVRDGFVHHGAHTGRWSGRGVQLQNLPKVALADPEATLVRLTAENGVHVDGPDAKLILNAQISGCLRALFLAPEGQRFVAADLSQIESRVLCWLAGQEDKLAHYRAGKDIYLPTAQALGSDSRELGKVLVLSAGFGASAKVLLRKAKNYDVVVTAAEAAHYIAAWRRDNTQIVAFWHALHGAFRQVVEAPLGAAPLTVSVLTLWRDAESARIRLPSGRELIYRNPRLVPQDADDLKFELVADLPHKGGLRPVKLWHGQLVENVVQAVACDVMTIAMLQLHREGVPIVATIHDEIVALVPAEDSERIRQRMLDAMRSTPGWAPGLPLAAEGYVNTRFIKPPKGNGVDAEERQAEVAAGIDPHVLAGDRAARADVGPPRGADEGAAVARGSRDRNAPGTTICEGRKRSARKGRGSSQTLNGQVLDHVAKTVGQERWQSDAALKPQPKRDGPDSWPSPRCLALALVHDVLPRLLRPPGLILEPAAGEDPENGALVREMRAAGYDVVARDIATGQDFLTRPVQLPGVRVMATNSPIQPALGFRRALLAPVGRRHD